MTDSVEVAIESVLLNRLVAFCLSPAIPLALPNIAFTPPAPSPTTFWLKADWLPADSFSLSLANTGSVQHYGILQVSVFYGQGSGELAPSRLATRIIELFPRNLALTKDGFVVQVWKHPFRARMMKDDPWVMIPVSVPYLTFAPHPA
jgi:hypothetical protein